MTNSFLQTAQGAEVHPDVFPGLSGEMRLPKEAALAVRNAFLVKSVPSSSYVMTSEIDLALSWATKLPNKTRRAFSQDLVGAIFANTEPTNRYGELAAHFTAIALNPEYSNLAPETEKFTRDQAYTTPASAQTLVAEHYRKALQLLLTEGQ